MKKGLVLYLVVFVCLGLACGNAWAAKLDDLRKAAENGDAMAQYKYADELAWLGIVRKAAMERYEKAAEAGSPQAKIAIASLRLAKMKEGSPEEKAFLDKTCPELKPVIEELEKNINTENAYNLGDVYLNGVCVKKNEKKALEYLRKAADGGNNKAQCLLGQIYIDMPSESGQALGLFKKAFESGLVQGGMMLASCYYGGKGTEPNKEEADKIVKEMEEWANPYAWAHLGFAFYRGARDFPRDEARGRKLLQMAANDGVEAAVKFLDKIGAQKDGKK